MHQDTREEQEEEEERKSQHLTRETESDRRPGTQGQGQEEIKPMKGHLPQGWNVDQVS